MPPKHRGNFENSGPCHDADMPLEFALRLCISLSVIGLAALFLGLTHVLDPSGIGVGIMLLAGVLALLAAVVSYFWNLE